jgi:DNA ligase 1
MKAFADLYSTLDGTTKTSVKVAALRRYFTTAAAEDAAWALYFLSGRKPRQVVPTRKLAAWASAAAGVEPWLFEESYHAVGDLAETIALLLPAPAVSSALSLSHQVEQRLLPLREMDEETQRTQLERTWAELDGPQRFVWNKLITGAFRVGVSQALVTRALAEVAGVDQGVLAHRLMGAWEPTPAFYRGLIGADTAADDHSRPYPFFLATPLEAGPETLGDAGEWQAEWKWDGIRSQLLRRGGQTFLWSRGEELVTDRYPELAALGALLPEGTALDGEILPWREGAVLAFAQLQKRIGRKTLGKKLLAEVPVVLMAYDLIEEGGIDLRDLPLSERRRRLEELTRTLALDGRLLASPIIPAETWDVLGRAREESRGRQVEGLMLKRRSSPYRVGRQRGDWWKWKIQPLTIDAVLVYAQRGSGKRASLYTDYTFAVWHKDQLVPVAKAYSGLTDAEIRKVDAFIRSHTVEKFGPVRSVTPELVFELGFEGIQASPRHKSGVAVRFPRILRWREDKPAAEADTLAALKALVPGMEAGADESSG